MKFSFRHIQIFYCASLLAIIFGCIGCHTPHERIDGKAYPVMIDRFDRALTSYPQLDSTDRAAFRDSYSPFFPIYSMYVLGLSDAPEFVSGIEKFLSDSIIAELYRDAYIRFDNLSGTEREMGKAFGRLHSLYPDLYIPKIQSHISGLNQSIVTTDSVLSISLDSYLGEEYPLYEQRFYNYERGNKTPERIVPDVIEVILRQHFPPANRRSTLLDRIVYEGKLLYLSSLLLPDLTEATLSGYTAQQMEWCKENEPQIWARIVSNGDLFSSDNLLINKYILPAPFTSPVQQDAPGRIGRWVGWQIVKQYVKRNSISASQISLSADDAQSILKASGYTGGK